MNNSNVKDCIQDITKSLATVFKKYLRNTRETAWERLTSKKGEKEFKKILADPNRPIAPVVGNLQFAEWLKTQEISQNPAANKIL